MPFTANTQQQTSPFDQLLNSRVPAGQPRSAAHREADRIFTIQSVLAAGQAYMPHFVAVSDMQL